VQHIDQGDEVAGGKGLLAQVAALQRHPPKPDRRLLTGGDLGGVPVDAEGLAAFAQLGLDLGTEVWLSAKATEVIAYGAQPG
jgi:hypothetical protein